MIKIDHSNILKDKIGSKHGISAKVLQNLCIKHQPLVGQVFRSKKSYGYDFLNLPDNSVLVRKIKTFATTQKKNKWETIVVLGIGGSSLGAIAIRDALLSSFDQEPRLIVADNIDPDWTNHMFSSINLAKTLFVVISKSGTTAEPMSLYALAKERLIKKFPKTYQKHFVFVTDPKKGILKQIAKEEGITTFDVPPKVGGRFSVLSAVGLLPAALAGVDISGLLSGAKEMRELIKRKKLINNPALLLAVTQFFMDRKKDKSMTILMPYSNLLFRVADWYRQLLAESIGKNKRTGPTPIAALGTTDQHSQLQLYAGGPNNKLIVFLKNAGHSDLKIGKNILPDEIGYLNGKKMGDILHAALNGTAESLAHKERPNLTIEVSKINAKSIGALFMLFEFQIALLGLMYKVNAFDQPGVEHGKKITKKILIES